MNEEAIQLVATGMRMRAKRARIHASILLATLTAVGIGSAFYFLATTRSLQSIEIGPSTNLAQAIIRVGGDFDWLQEITRSFVRIGGVLMAVFIVNILVSFARYQVKIADALETRADCLLLATGDTANLSALLAMISVDLIDFGKVPIGPYDRYLDTIKAFAPGVPSAFKGKAEEKTSN